MSLGTNQASCYNWLAAVIGQLFPEDDACVNNVFRPLEASWYVSSCAIGFLTVLPRFLLPY